MATVTEIAPDTFRISVLVPRFNLQFNQFLVRDDEPLLFHTQFKKLFHEYRDAVRTVVDPSRIRWIAFSHFESDECGALNQWLEAAPSAQAVSSLVGAGVNLDDFAVRPARGMADGDVIETGKHRLRFCSTVHLPHGWDAGMLFDEAEGTLFCSDLFFHYGDVEPLAHAGIVERTRESLARDQPSPFGNSMPLTPLTDTILERLAGLSPRTLAVMHGSSFAGDCAKALRDLSPVLKEVLAG